MSEPLECKGACDLKAAHDAGSKVADAITTQLMLACEEADRLRAAIEQHRRDYADAIGAQTKTRAEMNRKKQVAAHRLWEAIGRGSYAPIPSA